MIVEKLQKEEVLAASELSKQLNVSIRTIHSLLKELRDDGNHHGFTIGTVRGNGYSLVVTDENMFNDYLNVSLSTEVSSNRYFRIPKLFYHLLLAQDYTSIQELADSFQISRNTLLKDLGELKEFMKDFNLVLDSKSHHGVKIVGDELSIRKAMSRFVISENEHLDSIKAYLDFINQVPIKELSEELQWLFNKYHFKITKLAFDSIIEHLKVLLYRAYDSNFITELNVEPKIIDEPFHSMAIRVVEEIEKLYGLTVPALEIDYLATQIAGKCTVENVSKKDRTMVYQEVSRVLKQVDSEYLTDFSGDKDLKNNLLIHMIPLLTRVASNLELANPLVDFVSSRYANVFLIALRFIELWNYDTKIELSRDEVGYLALHFASHIERLKKKTLESYKRILIISEIGRANTYLVRDKLTEVFPKATIVMNTLIDTDQINQAQADLVLSTIDLNVANIKATTIKINELLTDKDVSDLKDYVILVTNVKQKIEKGNLFSQLFSEKLFFVQTADDYIDTIFQCATKVVEEGYAADDFPEHVLERERHFSTIYENGVAGPHSMLLNGHKDIVAVVILENSISYERREVKIIFVINMCKGNLFLYREVSRLIQEIIDNKELLDKLTSCRDFGSFMNTINKIEY